MVRNANAAAKQPKNQLTRRGGWSSFINNENVAGYIFLAPWLIGFLVFTAYPIFASLYYSFTNLNPLKGLGNETFVGFRNYIQMFTTDSAYYTALRVTFVYALVSVPLRLIFALLVAMLLNRKSKASGVYRTIYYLPSIVGGSVAVAVMWRSLWIQEGTINAVLKSIGIQCEWGWLTQPSTALMCLIILAVWQFGSSMLIFLAGLKNIPAEYYEAATVDGAGPFRKFFSITIPMLTPVIFFNLINQLILGFTAFTQSYITTGGDPMNETLFYALHLYRQGFTHNKMGYASAMAWVLLIIIALLTAVIFKSSNSWVYYESKGE